MTVREDGGPAFPVLKDLIGRRGQDGDYKAISEGGLTVRDWFAGQAIPEMIRLSIDKDGGWDGVTVAFGCYQLADALLAVRKEMGK